MAAYEPMVNHVPAGNAGDICVRHREVTPEESQISRLRTLMTGESSTPPGTYCQLYVRGTLMMSDVPFEQKTNREFVRRARGDVLLAGLGIGMVLVPVLNKPEVSSVTVIEKYRGVIELVQPYVAHPKLDVQLADIFEWQPPKGQSWDTLYFDIWSNITTDSLREITKLKRKFARRKKPGGWMGAWLEDHLRALKRRGRWR